MFDKMMILKNRLLTKVNLLLAAAFLVTTVASYVVSKNSLRHEIADNGLPLISDNIYSEIQKDLIRPVFISSMMASDTFLRDWILAGETNVPQLTRYLAEVRRKYGTFTSFFISENTRTYYHADGILKQVKAEEPRDAWYFRVRELARDYEINVDPDLANRDAMTIFVNFRVYDYQGHFIGVTGVGLTVNAVLRLIDLYQQHYHRSIYFIDQQGRLMAGGPETGGPDHRSPPMPPAEVIATVRGAPSSSLEFRRDGVNYLLNARFIPELGWHLFVEQEEDSALASIWHTLLINVAISIAIMAVVVRLLALTIRSYQDRLEQMATTDKLTGLGNRQAFDIVAPQFFHEVDRTGAPLSVILFDIDRFKLINDSHGHQAGDRVIREVATTVRAGVRSADPVCRWGGEEFLILLKDVGLDDADRLAEKLRRLIAAASIESDGVTIRVTVSLGVAQRRPGESSDSLIFRADKSLYLAKQTGRNRAVADTGLSQPDSTAA